MDPGMQAARDAQRAAEQSLQRMNHQAAHNATMRGMQDAEDAGRRAREAGNHSLDTWQQHQARGGAGEQHGLLASILLFPFKVVSFVLRLGLLGLVIAIIVVAAYVVLGGRLPI